MFRRIFVEEDGQTLAEYGLLVGLVVLVTIAILAVLGQKARNVFVQVNTRR